MVYSHRRKSSVGTLQPALGAGFLGQEGLTFRAFQVSAAQRTIKPILSITFWPGKHLPFCGKQYSCRFGERNQPLLAQGLWVHCVHKLKPVVYLLYQI